MTAVGKWLPDIGTAQDLGGNIFKNNAEFDLQNATGVKISAVGNQLNSSRVKGLFDLGQRDANSDSWGGKVQQHQHARWPRILSIAWQR